jgi:hypothetical protein
MEESASDYLKQLGQDFNSWAELLTSHSSQACYAIIAANWAVYGKWSDILNHASAKWSILLAVASIGITLFTNWLMAQLHYNQFLYAEKDKGRWEKEYLEYKNRSEDNPWPYTQSIQNIGAVSRLLKMIVPVTATVAFIHSLI